MFGQSNPSGGFGGFGTNNPNTTNTGTTGGVFSSGGGFGQQQPSGTGFGTSGGFGSNTGNAFGATTTTPGTAFGGGGFGQNTSTAFSATKPTFGAATGGGLFGTSNSAPTTNTSAGFGFGNTAATSGFGAGNTGASMFGSKSTFSAPATTTSGTAGGLFGTAGATTGTGGFGATTNTGGIAFGGANLPMQGTASVPYVATQEKEANSPTMVNHYQTIGFMPAYKGWSLEELRLQDYNQNRRYGNDSAGPSGGGFGFGTGFGQTNSGATTGTGFGATTGTGTGGLFGATNNQQTGGFGQATGGFGNNAVNTSTGGGLFGAAKPVTTGGLFGSSNTGTTGGGLFGSGGTANTGGFGNAGTTGAFGQTQNTGGAFGAANQAKPGFSFGTAQSTTSTTGFGASGAGFGAANAGGGLFGQQAQQPQQTGFGTQPASAGFGATGAFGTTNTQQQQTTTPFGGTAGFGNQQQKPAFGTGFGAAQAAPNTGGLFGNQQQPQPQQQQGGGLFGNNKPAFGATTTTAPSGGLFGNNQTQQAGGLFGNQQPAATSGLFGNQPNTANAGGGLFGSSQNKPSLFTNTAQNPNGGLFGNNSASQPAAGSSLFGGGQQQQQQQQGNSLFGSFGSGQQNQQQPQFRTSIADSPYGNSLLGSLGANQQNSPLGPIATPLGSSQTKKAAMIPHHKIAPRQPALTPRLGTSFSRSGSPFTASSLGNISNGSLGKSFSANNKLSLFDGDDSLVNSSAFSSSGSGRVASLKKLVIDKKIKDQDLFSEGSEPRARAGSINGRGSTITKGILKKTVSFDMGSNSRRDEDLFGTGNSETPVRSTAGPTPTAEELGYVRRTPERRREIDIDESPRASVAGQPEDETAVGNEVALVQQPNEDRTHGTYWMVPNASRLKSFTKEQQKKVIGLTIGRRGYGSVRFDNPVDITGLPCEIEDIPGNVVIFDVRVCTVYPEGMVKPAPGKGLNVPAIISLEECFPLTKNQRDKIVDPEHPRYITHIRRLKSIKDTEFVEYSPQNGLWIFKVRHFTTYGLVESDGEEEEMVYDEPSFITNEIPTLRQPIITPASLLIDDDDPSMDADISGLDSTSGLDDTFDFKRLGSSAIGALTRTAIDDHYPGSFLVHELDDSYDSYASYEEEEVDVAMDGESFLEEGSVGSVEEEEPAEPVSEDDEEEVADDSTVIVGDDEDITSALVDTPKFTMLAEDSPTKTNAATPKALPLGKDWTEQLNNTISPVKRRFGGENFFSVGNKSASPRKSVMEPLNYGLLDLANDLYGSPAKLNGSMRKDIGKTRKRDQFESPHSSKSGLEGIRPVTKKPISSTFQTRESFDYSTLESNDQGWRKAVRPTWGPGGIVVYMGQLEAMRVRKSEGSLSTAKIDFGTRLHAVPKPLELQLSTTKIRPDEFGIPFAETGENITFYSFTQLVWSQDSKDQHERSVWKLASVLWDPIPDVPELQGEASRYLEEKRRKSILSQFIEELVENDANLHAQSASTIEEAAFAHLTAHRVEQACTVLHEGLDLRLATLLPMLGGDKSVRSQIGKQLEHWRNKGVLAEISIPMRSLYELLAGETCFSEGSKGPTEDTTPNFFMAERFGLDWKRTLGLKLWYGCGEDESIASLVQKYEDDFNRHPAQVPRPKPWYPGTCDNREDVLDVLWGLLRIYADPNLPLEEVLEPISIGTNKIDYRVTWQLCMILAVRGARGFAGSKAQQITTDFAGGLENAGLWEWALFVVMHIQDADARGAAIKTIIGRHVEDIEDGGKLDFVEKSLRIPRSWIYEAKALQARHAGEFLQEAEYLINSRAWTEAHKTILTQVAPEAIISGNLEKLKKILSKFSESAQPEGWGLGGHVYLDYIRLRELEGQNSPKNTIESRDVARRLLGTLKNMERSAPLQNIAVREMAGIVGSFVLKQGDMVNEKSKVLELPLTEDQYLKKTVNLSLEYYKAKLQGVAAH